MCNASLCQDCMMLCNIIRCSSWCWAVGGRESSDAAVGRSLRYAREMKLPQLQHVLLPRSGVLHLALPALRRANAAEILDFTARREGTHKWRGVWTQRSRGSAVECAEVQ